jgi:cytochrome c-type biogenesis protein CcmH
MSQADMTNIASPLEQGLFWLATLLVLAGSAYWLMRAGAKGQAYETDRADIDVYTGQVGEIDRDLEQGRISEAEADASRLEIGRRLVKARTRVLQQGPRLNKLALAGLVIGVVFATAGFYLAAGSPTQSDLPFAKRERELMSRDPATLNQDEILVLLQERARLNPDDPVPHMLMGQVMKTIGRDQDALRAFQAVLRRNPRDSEAIAEAAGVLIRLNDNKMGPDAQAALSEALKINPTSPAASFYLGLVQWDAGQKEAAMGIWSKAYDALSAKPDGQALLATRATEVVSALDRGPSASAGQSPPMSGQSASEQAAFIGSMVQSRRARLLGDPGNAALRLSVVRVLIMSGQNDAARQTLLEGVQRPDATDFEIGMYNVAARALPNSATPPASVTKR